MFGDNRITDPGQVDDVVTKDLGLGISELDDAAAQLDAIRKRLEDKRRELENEQDRLRAEIEAASDRAARRAVVVHVEAFEKRTQDIYAELRRVVEEIDLVGAPGIATVSRAGRRCIIPFSDPRGYCACYSRKTQALAVLAQQISTAQAEVGVARAEYNLRSSQVWPTLRGIFTGGAAFWIFAFIWLGLESITQALELAVVAALAVLIAVIALTVYVEAARRRLLAAQAGLARAFLAYYRVQVISTCRPAPAETGSEADGDSSDEFQWWEKILGLPPAQPAGPDEPAPPEDTPPARVG